jgi:hypothetical protein
MYTTPSCFLLFIFCLLLLFRQRAYINIGDTNYTQSLQQRIALAALRMHTAKKEKKIIEKKKSPATIV